MGLSKIEMKKAAAKELPLLLAIAPAMQEKTIHPMRISTRRLVCRGYQGTGANARKKSDLRFAEIPRVLVRFNHVANVIVNANHSIM